jgi:probable O-glycosylation ligase (exosortase A-associated)
MRDVVLTLMIVGSVPLILRKPFFGVLVWVWLSLMNPHRLCWGFALNQPFAQIVALTLFAALLMSREHKRIPLMSLTALLALWWLWMLITTFFAISDWNAWNGWDKVWKIMLLTFVAIALLDSRERLQALVWTAALSMGFYGVKGGIFTIASGGSNAVYGPEGTFIGGNNEIGLALIMTVPLLRYIQLSATRKLLKQGMTAAMALTFAAILGTQSRGALVGLAGMAFYLILKSRNKAALLLLMTLSLPALFMLMPESWYSRMETIQTYQEDGSAQGRINAWHTAWNLALARPIVGGGFDVFNTRWVWTTYAPNPSDAHDAHSIYFEALGEHGFVGLILFLSVGAGALLALGRTARFAAKHPQLTWMRDMATMVYVSLIGYAVSGAFLGLAYFDYYYMLVAVAVGLLRLKQVYEKDGIPEPAPAEPPPDPKAPAGAGWPGARRRRGFFGIDLAGWYRRL